jgi:hypothetical protein
MEEMHGRGLLERIRAVSKRALDQCLKIWQVERNQTWSILIFFTEFWMNSTYFCRNIADFCVNSVNF